MACTNCKKSKDHIKKSDPNGLNEKKQEILGRVWDKSMGKLKGDERFIIFVFAWFPLTIGYINIVKFLISIF
tara:strand:+ start:18 stop:233 length:216 start_codon:yes stop_codon:yes gene_type:complete